VIHLDENPARRIQSLARTYRSEADCGFLEFALQDSPPLTRATTLALMEFATWPVERLRLCFDVTDRNFCSLFSDTPSSLRRRSRQLLSRVRRLNAFTIVTNRKQLTVEYSGATWNDHIGKEHSDYMLPTGETECVPSSINGDLDLDGWIVGTIPFGTKYGRIRAGQLSLSFRHGRVSGVDGKNRSLCRDLESAFEFVPGLECAVELAFGLSKGVARAAQECDVGCLWHERHFGVHLGLGATLERSNRKTNHHIDLVLARGRVLGPRGSTLLAWR
jgi:hypothetical protein